MADPQQAGAVFDPASEALNAAFWPTLHALRRQPPLRSGAGGGCIALTRHDKVQAAAMDPATFCSGEGTNPVPGGARFLLINSDPPIHSELRRQLGPLFTPQAVAACERFIRKTVGELLAAMIGKRQCDAIADLAVPLPALAVYEGMLGAPWEDLPRILGWLERIVHGNDPAAEREVTQWSARLLDSWAGRAGEPPVIRAVRAIVVAGKPVDMADKANLLALLILGAIDNTTSAIGTIIHVLAARPDIAARLRADPGAIPRAVEECLRFEAPIPVLSRTATRDTSIGGCPVTAGDKLLLYWSAANRDPDRYPHPDEIDIDREPRPHFSFGRGAHSCIGAHLARLELRVMVEELLGRTAAIEPLGPPPCYRAAHSRGFATLPIRLRARA